MSDIADKLDQALQARIHTGEDDRLDLSPAQRGVIIDRLEAVLRTTPAPTGQAVTDEQVDAALRITLGIDWPDAYDDREQGYKRIDMERALKAFAALSPPTQPQPSNPPAVPDSSVCAQAAFLIAELRDAIQLWQAADHAAHVDLVSGLAHELAGLFRAEQQVGHHDSFIGKSMRLEAMAGQPWNLLDETGRRRVIVNGNDLQQMDNPEDRRFASDVLAAINYYFLMGEPQQVDDLHAAYMTGWHKRDAEVAELKSKITFLTNSWNHEKHVAKSFMDRFNAATDERDAARAEIATIAAERDEALRQLAEFRAAMKVPMQTLNETIGMLGEAAKLAGFPEEDLENGETAEWLYVIKARIAGDKRLAGELLDQMWQEIEAASIEHMKVTAEQQRAEGKGVDRG